MAAGVGRRRRLVEGRQARPQAARPEAAESLGPDRVGQGKAPRRAALASFLSLTDEGWAWLGDHLDADLHTRSPVGAEVLQLFLGRLKTFLDSKNLALGDFMTAAEPPVASTAETVAADDPKARVTTAYYALSSGRANARVRIADLRRALATIPRPVFDGALLDLATTGEASLFRLDNPAEISPDDREAVLRTPSGEERHIIYLGGRGS